MLRSDFYPGALHLPITLREAPGENLSFGRGEAQRANAVPRE
jgi:hypothetical protein